MNKKLKSAIRLCMVKIHIIAVHLVAMQAQTSSLYSQVGDMQIGKNLADGFLLTSEFGLKDYYMKAELTVTSDPISQELLESTGVFNRLVDREGEFTRVSWVPKILNPSKDGNEGREIHVFNTHCMREEGLVEKKKFTRINNVLVHPGNLGTQSESEVFGFSFPEPYEFPLLSYNSLKNHGPAKSRDAHLIFKNFICVKTEVKGDKTITYWTPRTEKIQQCFEISFKDDVVVDYLWRYSKTVKTRESVPFTGKDVVTLGSVRTSYSDFDGGIVPTKAFIYMVPGLNSLQAYEIVAEMSYFMPDSAEFKSHKRYINRLIETVKLERESAEKMLKDSRSVKKLDD